MSHDIGQRTSGGPVAFCKARCEFAAQTEPYSEIGAARVIAAVTANTRNSRNVPKPIPVVSSNVGLHGQSK